MGAGLGWHLGASLQPCNGTGCPCPAGLSAARIHRRCLNPPSHAPAPRLPLQFDFEWRSKQVRPGPKPSLVCWQRSPPGLAGNLQTRGLGCAGTPDAFTGHKCLMVNAQLDFLLPGPDPAGCGAADPGAAGLNGQGRSTSAKRVLRIRCYTNTGHAGLSFPLWLCVLVFSLFSLMPHRAAHCLQKGAACSRRGHPAWLPPQTSLPSPLPTAQAWIPNFIEDRLKSMLDFTVGLAGRDLPSRAVPGTRKACFTHATHVQQRHLPALLLCQPSLCPSLLAARQSMTCASAQPTTVPHAKALCRWGWRTRC